jgi:hypothetical protein
MQRAGRSISPKFPRGPTTLAGRVQTRVRLNSVVKTDNPGFILRDK